MSCGEQQRQPRRPRPQCGAPETPAPAATRRPHHLMLHQECSVGQASAAAAFFARAAQRLNLSSGAGATPQLAGFCGAVHRLQPPLPPALQRRLSVGAKDFAGAGKVRVMLRVSGSAHKGMLTVDQRKKQVTLADPSTPSGRPPAAGVTKMFAFDHIFTDDDHQVDVCSTALTEALHAVVNGTDGCLFCFGSPLADTARSAVGGPSPTAALGALPCAVAWLFRAVAERRHRTGARFSVRVSAVEVGVAANHVRDLLQGHASEGEQPPGAYLREDPLQQHSELRAPTAERAAFYLDAALAARTSPSSHLVFTLHVYQYSVADLCGVAGGRSRLHVISLGDCHRSRGGKEMTLGALGGVLLAIFSGHKHLPHREHKMTQLLKDCFSSLMCHTTVLAHVSPLPCHYADTLATLQMAARLHRVRHRKIKFFSPTVGCNYKRPDSAQPAEGSDVDHSSSEQSADTVIYVGTAGDATDGEHPPSYTSSPGSKDDRCPTGKTPAPVKHHDGVAENLVTREVKEVVRGCHKPPATTRTLSCRNTSGRSGKSAFGRAVCARECGDPADNPATSASDEQWVDGPRVPRSRLFVKEGDLDLAKETWVDGPLQRGQGHGYGFMDEHKQLMIRSWVENQTSHMERKEGSAVAADCQGRPPREGASTDLVPAAGDSPGRRTPATPRDSLQGNDEDIANCQQTSREISIDVSTDHFDVRLRIPVTEEPSRQSLLKLCAETSVTEKPDKVCAEDYDDEYEIIEVEETSEAISMQDSCLQVTEEDIALCMEERERESRDSREHHDHPLHILSEENLTTISTFTDSTSASINGGQQPLKPSFEYVPLDKPLSQLHASGIDDFQKNHSYQYLVEANNKKNSLRQCFLPSATAAVDQLQRRKQHSGARIFHYHFPTRRAYNLAVFPEDFVRDYTDRVPAGVQSSRSEPTSAPQQLRDVAGTALCENCKRSFSYFGSSLDVERETYFRSVADGLPWLAAGGKLGATAGDGDLAAMSLRHPDGASNPSLSEAAAAPRPATPGPRQLKNTHEEEEEPRQAARCESSGYESFPHDSECSSSGGGGSRVDLHDPGGATQVLSCWQWMFCGSGGSPRGGGWTAAGGSDRDDPAA